jgi:ABC-2 type transport system permease protein
MRQALHAEWTKLRTVASTGWLLVGCIMATVGLSAAVCAAMSHSPGDAVRDVTKISLTGVVLGQAIVASLGVLVVASEYSTGMMSITLAATPRRSVVVAAKAVMVSAVTFAAGTIAVLGSLLAGRLIMPGNGFTVANGYTPLSLADGPTLRAAVGSALYLVFIALLSLGVASVVRESAVAVATVLGLLYLFPILEALFTDPDWQRRVRQLGPMSAGLGIQSTIDLRSLPLSPWAGLSVLAGWAAGALLAGGLVLKLRDA